MLACPRRPAEVIIKKSTWALFMVHRPMTLFHFLSLNGNSLGHVISSNRDTPRKEIIRM